MALNRQVVGIGLILIALHATTLQKVDAADPSYDAPAAAVSKMALLIGCTHYSNFPELKELYGPKNDVQAWHELLTNPQTFGFSEQEVRKLVGWPNDARLRPTYANIKSEFERLIARAEKDSRILIAVSGHGTQIPIPDEQVNPLDPLNPEPDGLDEVFLAADVERTSEKRLRNGVLDDEFAGWLQRLRAKGAHVFIVFDCCHAGTMSKASRDEWEVSRAIPAHMFGFSAEKMAAAKKKAQVAIAAETAAGRKPVDDATVKTESMPGSLVAFYGAQSFEEAPEIPFPAGAAPSPRNYYGLLTHSLVQNLRSRRSPLSYRELHRLLATAYRLQRGARPPIPTAEGDLDRQVLGLNTWPYRPTYTLERTEEGNLHLSAGTLHGIYAGSTLAVYAPDGIAQASETPLAYIVVEKSSASTSLVSPTTLEEDHKVALIAAEKIPRLARCEVVRRDLGLMQIRLFVRSPELIKIYEELAPGIKAMVRLEPDHRAAEWELISVDASTAKSKFGFVATDDRQVLLVHRRPRTVEGDSPSPELETNAAQSSNKIFGKYPSPDQKAAVIAGLNRDLPKVFKWQNCWRVVSEIDVAEENKKYGLELEIVKLANEKDRVGEVFTGASLNDRQELRFMLKHGGRETLWVSAFYLDANLGIRKLYSGGVVGGQTITLAQGTTSAAQGCFGVEGVIVFAVPQSVAPIEPDFCVLEQEPLASPNRGRRAAPNASGGAFGALLEASLMNTGRKGASVVISQSESTPAIISRSWRLLSGSTVQSDVLGGFQIRPDAHALSIEPEGNVAHMRVTLDRKHFTTVSASDGTVRLWETQSGRLVRQFGDPVPNPNSGSFKAYADDRRLARRTDQGVEFFDVKTGTRLEDFRDPDVLAAWTAKMQGEDASFWLRVQGASSAADNQHVWFPINGKPTLFDVSGTVKPVRAFDGIGLGYRVTAVSFAPDGNSLLLGLDDGTESVWDTRAKRFLERRQAHSASVVYTAHDPRGEHIISAGAERLIRRWPISDKTKTQSLLIPQDPQFPSGLSDQNVSISIDGTLAMTQRLVPTPNTLTGNRWHFLIWDLVRGEQIADFDSGDLNPNARFTADGKGIFTIGSVSTGPNINDRRNELRLWPDCRGRGTAPRNIRDFEMDYNLTTDIHIGKNVIATKVPDGVERRCVELRSLEKGEHLKFLEVENATFAGEVHLSPDGRFASASVKSTSESSASDGTTPIFSVVIWDIESGKVLLRLERQWFYRWSSDTRITTREFSRVERARTLYRLWDIAEKKEIAAFGEMDHLVDGHWQIRVRPDISSDGRLMLTAGIEGELRLWETDSGKLRRIIRAHGLPIISASLSPDGSKAVSAAVDGVKLWDLSTGNLLKVFVLPFKESSLIGVAIDSSNDRLLVAGANRILFFDF